MAFLIVEKNNPLAVHGIFYSRERAQNNIDTIKPGECGRGLFMDKTLTPNDFTVKEETK